MAKTIVLDPGHGQYGNAYITNLGFYEGTQMFKLGNMLKKKLEASGFKVIITRQKVSDDPSLENRGKVAGNNKADLFISLHSNAPGENKVDDTIRGVCVFYSIQDRTNNKKFASTLSATVASVMNTRDRGALERIGNGNLDWYGVLRSASGSGCKTAFLIEHGFHTSPSDAKMLVTDEGLSKIADADAKVICDWFGVNYRGASTGNETIVVPPTEITDTERYKLVTEVSKYTTAANALSGDKSLAVGTFDAGDYYIYKKYNGSYNLTKTVGTAGAWINPADNVKPAEPAPEKPVATEYYDVFKPVKKYSTAADAKSMVNNKGIANPGRYMVFKTYDGMYSLTTVSGTAGFWMNPEQNVYTNWCTYDDEGNVYTFKKGDTVIFRSGFTPRYGGNGPIIPMSVIAEVNGKTATTIQDFHTSVNNEYEVLLSGINAWVPVKYLSLYKKAESSGNEATKPVDPAPAEPDKPNVPDSNDLISILKDPKYEGIVEAIKSGILSEFLIKIIEEIEDDDTVEISDKDFELILGPNVATKQQIVDFITKNNPNFDPAIAEAFLTISKKYGIRGDVAICQSIIETGWFKYEGGTAVTPEQHNYCGLGVTSLGITGNSFPTIEIGVEAQLQHLYAYASTEELPEGTTLYDSRYKYITRGVAPRWIDLDGKWCAAGSNYGENILNLWAKMLNL